MSEELKPCPFCGRASELIVGSSYDEYGSDPDEACDEAFQVVCDASTKNKERGCGGSCGAEHTPEEAIKAWNTRTTKRLRRMGWKLLKDNKLVVD